MNAMNTQSLSHTPEFEALCADAKMRIKEISLEDTHAQKEGALFIDVREQEEFDQGFIEGAHHMSKGWIEAKIHTLATDKDQTIILYCGSGNRSALSADNLQKMGYSQVYSMEGGIKGWVKAGKPIITP